MKWVYLKATAHSRVNRNVFDVAMLYPQRK